MLAGMNKPAVISARRRAAAWAVHAFTASGAVIGFLAIVAVLHGDARAAFLWLGLALFVDGVDGTLARGVNVEAATPWFDGRTLDNIVDFLTYVIVPALMVYWFKLVPDGWETAAAAIICAVSCYTFANLRLKTHDWYFTGFPALWNIVVLCFWLLGTSKTANLAVILVLAALTFAPVKVIHPMRVRRFRPLTIAVTIAWGMSALRLALMESQPAMQAAPWAFWIFAAATGYFIALSLWRTFTA